MANENLKNRAKKGLVWSSIERFGTQGVQFLFGIILARLLSPKDYGIIAMPMIFLSIAQVFIDSGFSAALVRKTDLTEKDLSTAFYFNCIVGFIFYITLFFVSPLIADFYNTPILTKILKIISLIVLFNSLCTVQQTILTKKIDFKTQAKVSVISQLITGIVGIWMATNGYGVWSLVISQTAASALRALMFWIKTKWFPTEKWNKTSFKYLWGFGSKILAVGIIDTTYNNIYPLIIGKYYSAADLGVYTRAQHFSDLPSTNATGILQRVTFPIMSTIQDDLVRLKNNYRKTLKLSAYIIFPFMCGLAAVSQPLILILLGEKWESCILILQIICFARMWYPIHSININLLTVKGRSDLILRIELIKKAVGIVILIITAVEGMAWMCLGMVFHSLFSLLINTYYSGKIIEIGFIQQMKDLWNTLWIGITMFLSILIINKFIDNEYIKMIVDIPFGFIYYVVLTKIFCKNEFIFIKDLIFKK